MRPLRVRALLLDLDKTLVNVEDHVDYCAALEAAKAAADAHDVEIQTPRTTWGRCAHQAMELLVALSGDDERWQTASDAIEQHELQGTPRSQPMPGLASFLETAGGYRVAIVTLLGPNATASVLEQHAIHADAVVAREPGLRPKPAGDQVTEALHRLGVEPQGAVMIGDSSWDEVAAAAAGVRFLGLRNGRADTAFDEGTDIVEGLAEAADALGEPPGASASMVRHVPAERSEAVSGPSGSEPIGPEDPLQVPRFAGRSTFARVPRRDEVERCDVAVVGVPFDSGVTYRPGARFGPHAIRNATRLLRAYHPGLEVQPFAAQQVADAGDIACNPFDIAEAISQIEAAAETLLDGAEALLTLGGDHTIALPLLRVMRRRHGPVALLHFDAHLDTWDTYFGAAYTHGTPFRRAWEEGLLLEDRAVHVGIRGPLFSPEDLVDDERFGFQIVGAMELEAHGVAAAVARVRERLGDAPVYVSIDIDVLDPAHAPGTGTPEAGGLTSRELLAVLRGLAGVTLVGADIVEVSPPYDHAEMTCMAASHVAYELLGLFARRPPSA